MILKPQQLGSVSLPSDQLKEDRKHCRKVGPCGIGEKALYLNSFYIDRRYYLPISSVERIYKRVAMSRGGFSGKGLFASIPYLVVEYENGKEKQCNFKYEEKVDQMIELFHQKHPEVPIHSKAAQKRLEEKERLLEEKQKRLRQSAQKEKIQELARAIGYLEAKPQLYQELSLAARRKRNSEQSNPAYKWVALTIVLMGAVSLGYGIYSLITHRGFSMYFLLLGLAAVFLFSGANVLPTRENNRKAIQARLEKAGSSIEAYIREYPEFPVPYWYAHPAVLKWMQEILADGRAKDLPGALTVLKEDLKAINSSVTVDQETYDEIMAMKPLFLVRNYE